MPEDNNTPKKITLIDLVGILKPESEELKLQTQGKTFDQIREDTQTKHFQETYPTPRLTDEKINTEEGMTTMNKEFSEFLLQNKSKIRKVSLNNINYTITNDISLATHWRATEETVAGTNVSIGMVYPILYHRHEQEEVIVDDAGKLSLAYLVQKGEFLILDQN